jgi:hypothetical protein
VGVVYAFVIKVLVGRKRNSKPGELQLKSCIRPKRTLIFRLPGDIENPPLDRLTSEIKIFEKERWVAEYRSTPMATNATPSTTAG